MCNKRLWVALFAITALGSQAATSYLATEQYVQNVVKAESNRTDLAIGALRQEVIDAQYLTPSEIIAGDNIAVTTNEAGQVTITALLGPEADFTTNNVVLVDTIKLVSPPESDYATVSNKAMNALSNQAAKDGFTEWECTPEYLDGRLEVVQNGTAWALMRNQNGESILVESVPYSAMATTLEFPETGVRATRTQLPTFEEFKDLKYTVQCAEWYPNGSVTSQDEWTPAWDGSTGIKYEFYENKTAAVLPFCSSGESNSNLVGRVVIPPFVEFNDVMYTVVGIKEGSYVAQTNLTEIIAPTTVTYVGSNAFDGCLALHKVYMPGVEDVYNLAFSSCSLLVYAEFPKASSIANANGTFYLCSNLKYISLDAVTDIGDWTFNGCTSLAVVDFGSVPHSSIPTIGANAFAAVPNSCMFVVPDDQYGQWITAVNWITLYAAGYRFLRHSEWEYARKYEVNKKADKPATFTIGNLAKFDSDGNPIDAEISTDEIATETDLSGYVPTNRTINGKSLVQAVTLTGEDIPVTASNPTNIATALESKTDYNNLSNKPSINSVVLEGDKTAENLGLATTNDTTLTSIYDGNGRKYSEWVCDPATYNGYPIVIVETPSTTPGMVDYTPYSNGAKIGRTGTTSEDAVRLQWRQGVASLLDFIATRTKNQFLGYQLGLQSNYLLAEATTLLDRYYPEGNVKSAAELTTGMKYTFDATGANRTATVLPFCNTGTAANNNSSIAGRVVIPPFVDAQGNPYITDDGTRYKVVGVGDGGLFADFNTNLTAIVAPNTVTTIGDSALLVCTSLTAVSLPAATTIGSGAFDGCTSLAAVSLPAATTIGYGALNGCTSLSSISLSAAEDIGVEAFANCRLLSSVDFGNTPRPYVPSLGSGTFYYVPTSCKIIVPDAQYDAWTTASGWSDLVTQGYQFLRHSEWEYAHKYETVPVTRTINGQPLTNNVALTGSDIAISSNGLMKIDTAFREVQDEAHEARDVANHANGVAEAALDVAAHADDFANEALNVAGRADDNASTALNVANQAKDLANIASITNAMQDAALAGKVSKVEVVKTTSATEETHPENSDYVRVVTTTTTKLLHYTGPWDGTMPEVPFDEPMGPFTERSALDELHKLPDFYAWFRVIEHSGEKQDGDVDFWGTANWVTTDSGETLEDDDYHNYHMPYRIEPFDFYRADVLSNLPEALRDIPDGIANTKIAVDCLDQYNANGSHSSSPLSSLNCTAMAREAVKYNNIYGNVDIYIDILTQNAQSPSTLTSTSFTGTYWGADGLHLYDLLIQNNGPTNVVDRLLQPSDVGIKQFETVYSYAVGDLVIYGTNTTDKAVYRCTVAHPAGTWDVSHFTNLYDIASLASRASNPTADNIAALDASGNPTDSGIAKTNVASVLDTKLSPVTFTAWTFTPASISVGGQDYVLSTDYTVSTGRWVLYAQGGGYPPVAIGYADGSLELEDIYLEFTIDPAVSFEGDVTATRSVTGYTLGSQTNKVLQAQGDYATKKDLENIGLTVTVEGTTLKFSQP